MYTLTPRDLNEKDKMQGTVGIQDASSPKELSIEGGVASFDAAGDSYTANSSTVFIVADSDEDYDDYDFTVYTGVKNVPDIEGMTTTVEGKKIPAKVDVAATKDGVAKVVYIEDADVSGTGNVIFVRADTNPKYVKNSETGNYYELNAYMDGSATTIQVKEGTSAAKALVNGTDMKDGVSLNSTGTQYLVALKAINENSDGLVTSVRLYDTYTGVNGNGFIKGVGMEKAKDDAVLLDNITQWTGEVIGNKDENGNYSLAYAWDEEVIVAQYNDKSSKNQFSTSRISAIKDDANDKYVAVLDGDVIVGICTVYVEDGEPGAIEGENITTKVNDNATLTVDSKDAKADYIRMNANGDGTYRFQVTLPDDGKTYGQVKYTETVYVNNSSSYETTKEVTKTIPANKMIEGTIGVVIDTGDKVEVRITNVSLIETVPTAEQVTLTLKGNLTDAEVWNAAGTAKLDNTGNTTTDIDGNKTVTLSKDVNVVLKDSDIKAGDFLFNGEVVTIETNQQWPMTLTDNTILDNAPSTQVVAIHYADGIKLEGNTEADAANIVKDENNVMYVTGKPTLKITLTDPVNAVGVFTDDSAVAAKTTKATGSTMNITGGAPVVYLKPVAKVALDTATSAACGDEKFAANSDNYYVVDTVLTLTVANEGQSATIAKDGKKYGVGLDEYEVGYEDVSITSGLTVTLGKGVTATVDGENLSEGDKIVTAKDEDLSSVLKADTTVGTTVVIKTDNTVPYVTSVTTNNITANCTAVAMTKVTLPNSGETVEFFGGNLTDFIKIDGLGATLYVENGTQLRVTKTSGTASVEGVEPDESRGPVVVFTVRADNVTVQ